MMQTLLAVSNSCGVASGYLISYESPCDSHVILQSVEITNSLMRRNDIMNTLMKVPVIKYIN